VTAGVIPVAELEPTEDDLATARRDFARLAAAHGVGELERALLQALVVEIDHRVPDGDAGEIADLVRELIACVRVAVPLLVEQIRGRSR
jgi:hypothetical protein